MSSPELRKAWRLYNIQLEQNFKAWEAWEEKQIMYDTDEPPPE